MGLMVRFVSLLRQLARQGNSSIVKDAKIVSTDAYPYQPVSGVHYSMIGYIQVKGVVLYSLLPSLQLQCRSRHLHFRLKLLKSLQLAKALRTAAVVLTRSCLQVQMMCEAVQKYDRRM